MFDTFTKKCTRNYTAAYTISNTVKNLEFIIKQNCCDYIQLFNLLIFSGKIKRKEMNAYCSFLFKKDMNDSMKSDIYRNSTRNLYKLLRSINPRLLWQIGTIEIKYHIMRHFTRVCTAC